MLNMSKKEAKYIFESNGAIVFDLEELFETGVLQFDEHGFLIEDV